MNTVAPHRSVNSTIAEVELRAVQTLDVPADIAGIAAAATRRALRDALPGDSLSRRAESYFMAVVRRRMVRSRGATRAVSRMMAESIVDDLRRSGRTADDIWRELERGWGETLPEDVLEEYRVRLCA